MKRLLAAALAALLCLPLGGCMEAVGLGERAIVQAVGVDTVDGEYRLTFALADTSGGEKDGTGGKTLFTQGSGATVSEALRNAELQCGKELFWGQNKLIAVGMETARAGLDGVVGFFGASRQTRPNIDVVTVEGSAESLVFAKVEPGGAAAFTKALLENAEKNGRLPRTRLMELVGARETAGAGACTPLVRVQEEPDGTQSIVLDGLALYRENEFCGYADLAAARGVLWLRGDIATTDVAVSGTSGEELTMAVVRANTAVRPRLVNGAPNFVVNCSVDARLAGEAVSGARLVEQAYHAEQAAASVISSEMAAALKQTLGRGGCDVMGLALLLKKYEPEWYAQHSAGFESAVMNFTFTLDVEPHVARYGSLG